MLAAPAEEYLYLAVVHADGDLYAEEPFRVCENLYHVVRYLEQLGYFAELLYGHLIYGVVFICHFYQVYLYLSKI